MKKLITELTDEPPKRWNEFLQEIPQGNIMNTLEYGKYSRLEDFTPKYCRILDENDKIVLQVILYEYQYESTKIPKQLSKFFKKNDIRYRWNYGPSSQSNEATNEFFTFLKKTKKKFFGTTHPLSTIQDIPFKKEHWATFLINLKNSKEEIYKKIDKHSGRKNIERAIKRKVEIIEMTKKDLPEYVNILNQTRHSYDRAETSNELINGFWKILKPAGLGGFVARKDDKMIGALVFSFFNKFLNEWGVARSTEDFSKKLYSQDLIKWKIIEWGIEHKMHWYDFTGHNPNPKISKEKGILRYKKKWGGNEYHIWKIKR